MQTPARLYKSIPRPCEHCLKVFMVARHQERRYCSTYCIQKASKQRLEAEVATRFWSKVVKTETCWFWTGTTSPKGYGAVVIGRKRRAAHRVAWELTYGPVPEGMGILHTCPGGDNKHCVNPEHLRPGTNLDNMHDQVERGQTARGEQSGARRHPERVARGERCNTAKLTDLDVQSMRKMYELGDTLVSLAASFGITKHQVWMIVHRRHWTHLQGDNPSSQRRPGRARLTEDQVRAIRRKYTAGAARASLATEFSVTVGNIDAIVTWKSWKHLI